MIEHLSWDSDFFQLKTGRILLPDAEDIFLKEQLEKAISDQYELIYVFFPESLYIDENSLSQFNGKLVDRKIGYTMMLPHMSETNFTAEICEVTEISEELERLALISGQYSRFRLDNNFKKDDYNRLYQTWIKRSISREIADFVFVIREAETIEAMVTLKLKESYGEIGLIGVSEKAQGKGYGSQLLGICKNILIERNVPVLKVVTQLDNLAACRFYEKNDFTKEYITNIYHFWL